METKNEQIEDIKKSVLNIIKNKKAKKVFD